MKTPTDHLLNLWLENELSADEADELERRLRTDPDVREAYYDLLTVDHLLETGARPARESPVPPRSLHEESALRRRRTLLFRRSITAAAIAIFGLLLVLRFTTPEAAATTEIRILTSHDARLTIAQQPETRGWAAEEMLRLERGSCEVRLSPHVTARFDGPTVAERIGPSSAILLHEGTGSFTITPGGEGFELQVPGGRVSVTGTSFAAEVFVNGDTEIQVEAGTVEIHPRGSTTPVPLAGGEALRLDVEGGIQPATHRPHRFLPHLPHRRLLFSDSFEAPEGTPLDGRRPPAGDRWEVFHERNPTLLNHGLLDTSNGERLLVARLPPHQVEPDDGVYVLTFDMRSPEAMHDKVKRQDGFESITLLDHDQQPLVSLRAEAVDGHRWYLHDEHSGMSSKVSHLGALWKHTVTLCYGDDGRATLHDGSTAQAPMIAGLRLDGIRPVAAILLTNQTGGDLALNSIRVTLLTRHADIP